VIGVRDFARRVILPSAALWVLESKAQGAVRSRIAKLRGRDPRAELFVAFDDPYAPLALAAAAELASLYRIDFDVFPILKRGTAGDANLDRRRRYSVLDARRLARRRGIELAHDEPVDPARIEKLTYWVEAARAHDCHRQLATAFAARLWAKKTLPDFGELYALYKQKVDAEPPRNLLLARHRVRQNEARLVRRGHWDSSAMWLEGKLFMSYERREQMADYLRELDA